MSPPSVSIREPIAPIRVPLVEAFESSDYKVSCVDSDYELLRAAAEIVIAHFNARNLGLLDALLAETPDRRVIAAIDEDDTDRLPLFLSAGAASVVFRGSDPRCVVHCANGIRLGMASIPGTYSERLQRWYTPGMLARVTPDEGRWLVELASGRTVGAVASANTFSERQFTRRLSALYRKLGVTRLPDALFVASILGIVDSPLPGYGTSTVISPGAGQPPT